MRREDRCNGDLIEQMQRFRAVRTGFATLSEPGVRTLLARADDVDSVRLRRWREQSLRLMGDPGSFDYEDWCAGGLARRA